MKGALNTTGSWIFWWSILFFFGEVFVYAFAVWWCCSPSFCGHVVWRYCQILVLWVDQLAGDRVCFFLHGLTKCQSFVPWTINWSHCFDVIAVVEFICLFAKKSLSLCVRVCVCVFDLISCCGFCLFPGSKCPSVICSAFAIYMWCLSKICPSFGNPWLPGFQQFFDCLCNGTILRLDLDEDGKVIMHSFEVDMKAGRQGGRKRSKFKQNPLEWL